MSICLIAPPQRRRMLRAALFLAISGVVVAADRPSQVQESGVDGLTEPYRTVDVASAEAGILTRVAVREGETVRQGQILAVLDSDIYVAMLAIARKNMEAQGALNSAIAEVQLRQDRLEKFVSLRASDHARQEEVDRARTELAVAEARLLAVQEDLVIKKLEHDRIKAQLDRRTIRAPLDGVITRVLKDEGEAVAITDPVVLTIVQLDPLVASFSVTRAQTRDMRVGQSVPIRFSESAQTEDGIIEFIAPVTDAESGTLRVKVRLPNGDGKLRSGERCVLAPPGPARGALSRRSIQGNSP